MADAQYVHESKIEEQRVGKVQGTEHSQTKKTTGSNCNLVTPYYSGHHQLLLQVFIEPHCRNLVSA